MTTLPLDYTAIERILPHRYPFLLVDRVTELEPDKRIVGIKNVSLNERYLSPNMGDRPTLPPTILTEAVAQVGAILILAKPENRRRLPFFAGIQRVRYRRPVRPGDVVEIEAVVLRLRSRMGLLKGVARVNGQRVKSYQSRDELRDLLQQLVEVEHRRDLAAQLKERDHQLTNVRGHRYRRDDGGISGFSQETGGWGRPSII